MEIRCGWEGEIHVGIVREHEHEGNGSEHICMCKSKGMGGIGVTEHGDGGEKKFPVTQHASRCLTQHGGRMGVLPISHITYMSYTECLLYVT